MTSHDNSAPRRPTRLAPAAIVVAALLLGASVAGAVGQIDGPATVAAPATRIMVEHPGLLFPMAPQPKCEVFNNFGGFSKTNGSGGHQGVDIGSTHGQEVYAVERGVLVDQLTDLGSAAGNGWKLVGDSGTQYRYYHLDSFAADVLEGAAVDAGDVIGFVGDTGNATPGGYHLHFEVRPGPPYNTPVDPVPLLAIPPTCNVYPKQ